MVGLYNADRVECFESPPFDDDGKCSKLLGTVDTGYRPFGWVRAPDGGTRIGDGE